MSLLVSARLRSLGTFSSVFVLTTIGALVCGIEPARAVCSPTSGSNVSCTGTTVNQAGGGQGYTALFSNVTVGSDASVIGSSVGMFTLVSTVTNAGTISGTNGGIVVGNQTVIYNSGVISGGVGIATGPIAYAPTAEITNSGTIIGTAGFAISVNTTSALTLLPGSKIAGSILISGFAHLNVSAANQNLTFFNSLGGTTVTIGPGLPGVASGNTLVTVDPTMFGVTDRTLLAFTGAVTGIAGSRTSTGSASGDALGFAATENATSSVDDAFAQVMGYAKTSTDAVWFKNPTVTAPDGTTVWARGFTGHRVQQADGVSLRNVTDFYGGAIGIDKRVAPDLLLGGYGGGGSTLTRIDPAMGDARSDIGFGGIYGRKDIGKTFIDFGLLGGATSNHSSRIINNNLAAGGLETATANFGGWFVSPELALGYRHALAPGWTLTPTARVRYLAAGYDGYTESGSTANLTVGNRTLQNVEERGELNLTYTTLTDAVRFQIGGYGGVIGQQRVGDSDVNATLLGQALAFAAPGHASIAGGFVGTTLDWRLRSGVGIYGGVEYTALTDHSSTVTGRAGLRVGF